MVVHLCSGQSKRAALALALRCPDFRQHISSRAHAAYRSTVSSSAPSFDSVLTPYLLRSPRRCNDFKILRSAYEGFLICLEDLQSHFTAPPLHGCSIVCRTSLWTRGFIRHHVDFEHGRWINSMASFVGFYGLEATHSLLSDQ